MPPFLKDCRIRQCPWAPQYNLLVRFVGTQPPTVPGFTMHSLFILPYDI